MRFKLNQQRSGKNHNKTWSDLSEPKKMSIGKNQDKPLIFKMNQQMSRRNLNKSWSDLSKPEKISMGKNQDKPLRDLN